MTQNQAMFMNCNKSHALSTVLTTVIILVASVVLASGVVLYGSSLFQGGTQQESISVTNTKLWVHSTDPNGLAWGAVGVRNIGDKVVSVDKIKIRGSTVPFNQWYSDNTVTSTLFQQDLNFSGWSGTGGLITHTGTCADAGNLAAILCIDYDSSGSNIELINATAAGTGPISVSPGSFAIIYFKLTNGTLTPLDSGQTTSVTVSAGKTGSPESVTIEGKTNTG
jgi:hypothetical protein